MGNSSASQTTEPDVPTELPKFEIPEQFKKRTRRCSVSAESDREQMEKFALKVVPKTHGQLERIRTSISTCFLFSLDKVFLEQVLGAMMEKKVNAHQTIIQQGDAGDFFYVIESGYYEVFKNVGGEERKVFSYNGKGFFGELALMYNCSRLASVKASTKGVLWALDRATFQHIVIAGASKTRALYETFIEKVPLFANLTHAERSMIADCLVPETYENDAIIVKQGDHGDKFYLIERGQTIALQHNSEINEDVVVGAMTAGQYFGERALITKQSRAATVKAVGEVKCAVMDRASFERLLGDCREVMQRHIDKYETAVEVTRRRSLSRLPSAPSSAPFSGFSSLPASVTSNTILPTSNLRSPSHKSTSSDGRRPSWGEVTLGDQGMATDAESVKASDLPPADKEPEAPLAAFSSSSIQIDEKEVVASAAAELLPSTIASLASE